jgi:hypothetical protein
MKRFWLVLLALGMLFAFSSSVFAADVKFTGSYYAAGMYMDKTNLRKDYSDVNTAFYYQRLRVGMYFVVTPALSLVTRFDVMERAWGAPRTPSTNVTDPMTGGYAAPTLDRGSLGTTAENENIAFDWAYIQYVSPIGAFMVGYQNDGAYGTVFGDSAAPLAKIQYVIRTGPVTVGAYAGKSFEGNKTAKLTSNLKDTDQDKYVAFVNYAVNKDIQVGLLGVYYRIAQYKGVISPLGGIITGATDRIYGTAYGANPFFKAKFGPIALEGEALWIGGKVKTLDAALWATNGTDTIKLNFLNVYLDAMADLGMFYAGGTFAYMSGDKAGGKKWEGGQVGGGWDWNPTLIMFNFDRTYWAGTLSSSAAAGGLNLDNANGLFGGRGMNNAWFYQGRVGVRPIPALDIMASLAYAKADKRTILNYASYQYTGQRKDYGWELDVTATYAITNNLSYMLGVGYLWTGDYFKGGAANYDVQDDYLVINKLTLTF